MPSLEVRLPFSVEFRSPTGNREGQGLGQDRALGQEYDQLTSSIILATGVDDLGVIPGPLLTLHLPNITKCPPFEAEVRRFGGTALFRARHGIMNNRKMRLLQGGERVKTSAGDLMHCYPRIIHLCLFTSYLHHFTSYLHKVKGQFNQKRSPSI